MTGRSCGGSRDCPCFPELFSTKIIATFSVGFDHIDIAAANARGIVVTNTPEVLSFATAECAFTLMLMAARRAGEGERMVRAGKWKGWAPTQLLGVTLERKKLGILGSGRIGRELASIARGFRMEIHYRDLDRLPPELEQGATYHDNDEDFLRTIDVLSMHVPGREGTRKWLNAGRLATMKRGAIVVNTARGALVDDEALASNHFDRRSSARTARQRQRAPSLRSSVMVKGPTSMCQNDCGVAPMA
jgi:lactate dehydrogenase-like 2-hydroxyacid dehydrogenase